MRTGRLAVAVEIGFGPRLAWALALLLPLAWPPHAGTDQVSLSTYYPAPAGVYRTLLVTGPAEVGRDGHAVLAPRPLARVGIGTTDPQAALHLRGHAKVSGCIILGSTRRCQW